MRLKNLKEVIALADNQMLRSIRQIKNHVVDSDLIEQLYSERNKLKKNQHLKENSLMINELQNKINKILFVPDYLAVVIDHPSHYNYIFKKWT